MDAVDDGEFCVALRSALLRDRDRPPLRGGRHRRRLRPRLRARRDRDQARRAAAAAGGLISPAIGDRGGDSPVQVDVAGPLDANVREDRSGRRPTSGPRGPSPRGRGCRTGAAAASTSSDEGVVNSRSKRPDRPVRPAAGSRRCPPPPLSTTTIRSGPGTRGRRRQAAEVVGEGEIAEHEPRRLPGADARSRLPSRPGRRSRSLRGWSGSGHRGLVRPRGRPRHRGSACSKRASPGRRRRNGSRGCAGAKAR